MEAAVVEVCSVSLNHREAKRNRLNSSNISHFCKLQVVLGFPFWAVLQYWLLGYVWGSGGSQSSFKVTLFQFANDLLRLGVHFLHALQGEEDSYRPRV